MARGTQGRTTQAAGARTSRARARGARPSLARDWEAAQRTLAMFERLVDTAERAKRRDPESGVAEELEGLAWQHLREAEPIRVSHAEEVLGVSNQTVRSWIGAGILDDLGGSPQRVGLESVMRAKLVADELREQGRDREFMSAVLSRLDALALEQEDEFRKSVGQMRRRQRRPRPY